MTIEAAGTAASEEAGAVDTAASADLSDLSTEQVAEENGDNSVVDTDVMTDEDFSKFMDSQLDVAEYEAIEPESADGNTDSTEHTSVEEDIAEDGEGTEAGDANPKGESHTVVVDGQEIVIDDPADIQRLLERGLRSGAEAKANLPAQKLAQMLANNKLSDENTLNRLIDVAKGDKKALIALLAEHDIDPYSLVKGADGEDTEYTPTDHSVSDNQIELNQVLDSLQDSESFATTADVVMEQWDAKSRQTFMENPRNFTILNNQVADGTYKAISDEMKKLDMLGKLPTGATQFDVYMQVGDRMFSESKLPGQEAPAATTKEEEIAQQPAAESNQPTAEQRLQQAANLQKRKRAVAPNRSIPQSKPNQQVASEQFVNSSSDEEFIAKTRHLFNKM